MIIYIHFVFLVMILHNSKATFNSLRTGDGTNAQAMSSFANLLKTIIRVNEERVEAIRKIATLQDYMLTRNRLKFDDDYYDSDETPDTSPVNTNIEDTPKSRRSDDRSSLKKKCDQLYAASEGQPTPEIKKNCSNHAFHKCTLSCVHNFEKTCHTVLYCTAELVDKAAKDCMRNCKKLFEPQDI